MGVPSEAFKSDDVYIDFQYERVMFHFVKESGKVFRKFYGDSVEKEVPHTSKLFADAQIGGNLTTMESYSRGTGLQK
jgi:hypothetical protein